jgi:hypothetical protein
MARAGGRSPWCSEGSGQAGERERVMEDGDLAVGQNGPGLEHQAGQPRRSPLLLQAGSRGAWAHCKHIGAEKAPWIVLLRKWRS